MEFAHELYQDVNQAPPQSVHITEVSLTANQPHKTMVDKKIKWKGKTLAAPVSLKFNQLATAVEDHANTYTFEPMRIRQFEIEYNKIEKKQKLATSDNQIEAGGLNIYDERTNESLPGDPKALSSSSPF